MIQFVSILDSFMTVYQMQPYDISAYHPARVDVGWKTPGPFKGLHIDLPRQQYKTGKIVPIPFDPKASNNGRFDTLGEAMLFIARHCMFHHQNFKRNMARHYLRFCRILDFAKAGYFVPSHLAKRDFDVAFTEACRALGVER